MGFYSKAKGVGSIALGSYSKVMVDGGLSGTALCLVGLLAFLGIRLFCKDWLKTPNLNGKVRKFQ
ncbi:MULTISPECIES: hypothetical protein [unclassified Bartonella]|uniref:hypothetical protein n=1 Tax=unclassified Bartonella TaxID=2645622 RepID=UPI0035CF1BB9